jgi:hypothetical protein
MELIGGLFTTLIGGGGSAAAAGGTAAAAGAAGAAAGGVGSSALTLLQGAGSVFSALTTIGSGAAAYAAGQTEKNQQNFEATNEYISGKETSAALKAELARTVSNQAVAFAAGGVDLGSVSVGQAKAQATKDAEDELSSNANSTLVRYMQRRRMAKLAAQRGQTAATASLFGAGGQIADFGVDVLQRG